MNKIIPRMLWNDFQGNVLNLGVATFIPVLFGTVFPWFLSGVGTLPSVTPANFSFPQFLPLIAFLSCVCIVAGAWTTFGRSSQHDLKPLSNLFLALYSFTSGTIVTLFGTLATLILWQVLFSVNVSIPQMFWLGMGIWGLAFAVGKWEEISSTRLLSAIIAVAVFILWIWSGSILFTDNRADRIVLGDSNPSLVAYDSNVASVLAALGLYFGYVRIANDRSQQTNRWTDQLVRVFYRVADSIPTPTFKNLGEQRANFLFESIVRWRPYVACAIVMGIVAIVLLVLDGQTMAQQSNSLVKEIVFVLLYFNAWLFLFVGLVAPRLGKSESTSHGPEKFSLNSRFITMGEFRHSLPVSSADFSTAILRSIGVMTLVVVLTAAACQTLVFSLTGFDSGPQSSTHFSWWQSLGLLALLNWCVISNFTLMAYSQRTLLLCFVTILIVAIAGGIVGTMTEPRFASSGSASILRIACILTSVLAVSVFAWKASQAIRLKVLGKGTVIIAFAIGALILLFAVCSVPHLQLEQIAFLWTNATFAAVFPIIALPIAIQNGRVT